MWMPLKKYCDKYPWPTLPTLRWMIWKIEQTLGKQAPFIHRYGKRVLIDGEKFQVWITTEEAYKLKNIWLEKDRETKALKKSGDAEK